MPETCVVSATMSTFIYQDRSDGDTETHTFDKSPIMSTYLVAYAVGRFVSTPSLPLIRQDSVEGVTDKGILFRVFTPPGKSDQGKFSLAVGMKVLSLFSDFFSNPYPLPKMDMIAVSDFAAGAMENWGLVTYRETALLVDDALTPLSSRQRIAYVVAHELAHQWFGNLVTMTWWTDLWLNEGFATWVGNFAIDELFPEWDVSPPAMPF
jgi:puromycin-sensitive aminopeptidase